MLGPTPQQGDELEFPHNVRCEAHAPVKLAIDQLQLTPLMPLIELHAGGEYRQRQARHIHVQLFHDQFASLQAVRG